MNKKFNLNDKEATKSLETINNFTSGGLRQEIKLMVAEKSGRLWPYWGGKKALSASTLTKILREIEYKGIPEYILFKAKKRGEEFHNIIQKFVQNGNHPSFVSLKETNKLNELEKRIHETINFLKGTPPLEFNNFLGSEKLHYEFHKGELLAAYVDLEFQNYIVELKTNNIKANQSSLALLVFEIQLLIQHLCTKKNIYLLWSTGKGITFKKIQASGHLLKILDMLIDLVQNEEVYSLDFKKKIIEKIIDDYSPARLNFKLFLNS